MDSEKDQKQRLVKLVRDAVLRDKNLRDKYQIGDKFRFIRDRLQSLLERLEKHAQLEDEEEKKLHVDLAEDEAVVYAYLYNAHGLTFKTWQNMMTQKNFYEYSVNRPIYLEKSHVEALLRTKSNKAQHGYLVVAIKKKDILRPVSASSPKDANDNPVIKVKEGALRIEKLISFNHNLQEYILDSEGKIIKKLE